MWGLHAPQSDLIVLKRLAANMQMEHFIPDATASHVISNEGSPHPVCAPPQTSLPMQASSLRLPPSKRPRLIHSGPVTPDSQSCHGNAKRAMALTIASNETTFAEAELALESELYAASSKLVRAARIRLCNEILKARNLIFNVRGVKAIAAVLNAAKYKTAGDYISDLVAEHELLGTKLSRDELAMLRHYRRALRRGNGPERGAAAFTVSILEKIDAAVTSYIEGQGVDKERAARVQIQHIILFSSAFELLKALRWKSSIAGQSASTANRLSASTSPNQRMTQQGDAFY